MKVERRRMFLAVRDQLWRQLPVANAPHLVAVQSGNGCGIPASNCGSGGTAAWNYGWKLPGARS
jgi:hypothetical protein